MSLCCSDLALSRRFCDCKNSIVVVVVCFSPASTQELPHYCVRVMPRFQIVGENGDCSQLFESAARRDALGNFWAGLDWSCDSQLSMFQGTGCSITQGQMQCLVHRRWQMCGRAALSRTPMQRWQARLQRKGVQTRSPASRRSSCWYQPAGSCSPACLPCRCGNAAAYHALYELDRHHQRIGLSTICLPGDSEASVLMTLAAAIATHPCLTLQCLLRRPHSS